MSRFPEYQCSRDVCNIQSPIRIIVRREQDGRWSAEIPSLTQTIPVFGDSKKYVVDIAKSEVLKYITPRLESYDIELNSIEFKVDVRPKNKKNSFRIRDEIARYKSKFLNWCREKPYFEFLFEMTLYALVIELIFLGIFFIIFLVVSVMLLVYQARLKDNQFFIPILVASLAFSGVLLTIISQVWLTFHKDRLERQKDSNDKMLDSYESIIKIISNPGTLALEEVLNVINEFDNKVRVYTSDNIVHQWSKIKPILELTQADILKVKDEDYHSLKNFVDAIRREMGHSSNSSIRAFIQRDLKFKYEKMKKRKIKCDE